MWNVAADNADVVARGNGGAPRVWMDALDGSRVDPFRWPRFRAVLAAEEAEE